MSETTPDRSVTETLARAIHSWMTSPAGHDGCQAREELSYHWPCWHLAHRLAIVVDDEGWRTSPSTSYREGELKGRLEIIRIVKQRGPSDEDLNLWERRLKARDRSWDRGIKALDGPSS